VYRRQTCLGTEEESILKSKQSLCALFSVITFYSKTELTFAVHPIFEIFVILVQTPLMHGKGSYKTNICAVVLTFIGLYHRF
jgi:hypothetical protein